MKPIATPETGLCPYAVMDVDVVCCEDCLFYLNLHKEEQLCSHPKVRFETDVV